jgi:hypothetical protein
MLTDFGLPHFDMSRQTGDPEANGLSTGTSGTGVRISESWRILGASLPEDATWFTHGAAKGSAGSGPRWFEAEGCRSKLLRLYSRRSPEGVVGGSYPKMSWSHAFHSVSRTDRLPTLCHAQLALDPHGRSVGSSSPCKRAGSTHIHVSKSAVV